MLVAAPLDLPRVGVPAVAAASWLGPVEEDLVAFVVRVAEALVAEDAGGVGLAGSTVPGDVAGLEDVAAGLVLGGGGWRVLGGNFGEEVEEGRRELPVLRVERRRGGVCLGEVLDVVSVQN